jgi:hypothetical protein
MATNLSPESVFFMVSSRQCSRWSIPAALNDETILYKRAFIMEIIRQIICTGSYNENISLELCVDAPKNVLLHEDLSFT